MENIIETPNKKNRMPPTTKSQMRKFKFEASDKDLMDLHRRIEETRWPERETSAREEWNIDGSLILISQPGDANECCVQSYHAKVLARC